MKRMTVSVLLAVSLILTGCDASASDVVEMTTLEVDKTAVTEFQIDEHVQVKNGDADVAKLSEVVIENAKEIVQEEASESQVLDMGDDMSLFTPEDIALLDNLANQDWLFKEDQTWMMRFEEDIIIIGQSDGQITDILKYHITDINHDEQKFILHIVERENEHSGIDGTKLELSYYCDVIIAEDELTYVNKLNCPDQMTETVWVRQK